jgi:hypothetical protein
MAAADDRAAFDDLVFYQIVEKRGERSEALPEVIPRVRSAAKKRLPPPSICWASRRRYLRVAAFSPP